MKNLNKRERRELVFKKIKKTLFLILIVYAIVLIYKDFDKRMDDATNILLETKSRNILTEVISNSLAKILKDESLTVDDLYSTNFDNAGELLSININTILVNDICNKLSNDINNALANYEVNDIQIPIFSLYDVSLVSGIGPCLSASLMPMGSVNVDYETSFQEAGINQTSFELWLNVKTELQMTNPITKSTYVYDKKVPIISTIINGQVPEYINTPNILN